MSQLIDPGLSIASGVIVSFWNEVKDSCGSSSLKAASGTCPVCFGGAPAGETADDSVMVKATARAEDSARAASDEWRDVCRVGIGKGLATMGDYGIASSLMNQLAELPADTDPAVAQALYERFEALETKYSGPQNPMPREAEDAPDRSGWCGALLSQCYRQAARHESLQFPYALGARKRLLEFNAKGWAYLSGEDYDRDPGELAVWCRVKDAGSDTGFSTAAIGPWA